MKAIILAGGHGKRLWPLSRLDAPKQIVTLPLAADQTLEKEETTAPTPNLLDRSITRLSCIIPARDIFISTEHGQIELIKKKSHHKGISTQKNFIIEPIGKDTAAAILLSLLTLKENGQLANDPVLFFTPADQYVGDETLYQKTVLRAAEVADTTKEMTVIGIPPTRPATEYGYLEVLSRTETQGPQGLPHSSPNANALVPPLRLRAFHEKPNAEKASAYHKTQRFLWNAGMFFITASSLLLAYEKHAPRLLEQMTQYFTLKSKGTHDDANKIFMNLEKISFDYAIAEKLKNIFCITGNFGWDDLGSFDAMERLHHQGLLTEKITLDTKNLLLSDVLAFATENVFAYNSNSYHNSSPKNNGSTKPQQTLILNGLQDLNVIVTPEIIYISHKKDGIPTKELLSILEKKHPDLL